MRTAFTVTFSPDWWNQNYYTEPGRRTDMSRVAGRREDGARRDEFLRRRYGDIDLAGLRGVRHAYRKIPTDFGTVVLPGLLGCRLTQADGMWWAEDAGYSDDALRALQAPDPETTPPFTEVLKELDALEAEIGRDNLVNAYETVNIQGPLNIALKLRGEQLFVDMLDTPELAHRALEVSTTMIEKVVDLFRHRFGPLKVRHDYGYCIAHCPLVMISPTLYETFVLPYENRLADRAEYVTGHPDTFELHHCTSKIDPYLPAYQKIKHLSKLDGGDVETDFRLVKRTLPGVRVDTYLDPAHVGFQSVDELLHDVQKLSDSGVNRLTLEVTPQISDEKVRAFLRVLGAM